MIPKVSIIIPHWNGIETLSECLDSITCSDFKSYEVIVSDNNSTDGSQDWIKKNYPDVKLIESKNNYGYAGGCNKGAKVAKGSYLLFLNNDTIQDSGWLEPMIELFEKDKKIAAVQPKILNYYDKNIFDYAGACGGHIDIFSYPFARGRIFLLQEVDKGQYNNAEECFWASGAAIMIRKSIFFSSGEFDETFFSHMEEIDLCWRFYAMGYKVWVEPKSVVYHKNAISLPMNSQKKYYLNHRNSLIMTFSNYTFFRSLYLGLIRITFELVSIVYTIIKLDFRHTWGIIKALGWIILHPASILKKRSRFKRTRKEKDEVIMKNMFRGSIVFEHFLLKKDNYSKLFSKAC